jgi:flagellar biosynthesis/type III secretory pathway protein FliH
VFIALKRQYLLVNFVETYLTLNEDEQAVYEGLLDEGGHRAVQALEMTWGERLREEGREEGREKGREEGREKGREEGREKGQAEGREIGALEAKREMLLDMLRIRFGDVPEALTATIAQADDSRLSQMFRRAVLASSLEELGS